MKIFVDLIAPIILLILLAASVAWMAVWVTRAGHPGYRFAAIVFKAALAPSILRVGCLWSMFPGVASDFGTLEFLVLMIGFYPEGVLFPNALLVSSRDNRWMIGGTLLLSLVLTLSVLVVTTISAALVLAARRLGGEARSKHTREQ